MTNMLNKSNDYTLPKPFREFLHVNRYWDKQNNLPAAKILPGEYYVTGNNEIITTVLGSCVSVCIIDPISKICGMNHFMLPVQKGQEQKLVLDPTKATEATRYGNWAMEHMINDMLKYGANKNRFIIKIFGGSNVLDSMNLDIGEKNVQFTRDYLKLEGYKVDAEDVCGVYPRKVLFFGGTGEVRIKKFKEMHNRTIIERETNYRKEITEHKQDGSIELF